VNRRSLYFSDVQNRSIEDYTASVNVTWYLFLNNILSTLIQLR